MRTDWIFINATTHRTGSTFLQRLVNASEEAHIWGETNITPKLHDIATLMEKAEQRGGGQQRARFEQGDRDTWMAHMVPEPQRVRESLKLMFWNLFGVPGKRAGLKDVRKPTSTITFLAELFPEARFLLLTRNPFDALLSYRNTGWPGLDEHSFLEAWVNHTAGYRRVAEDLGNRARFLRLEDIDQDAVPEIYGFLGLPFNEGALKVLESRVGSSTGESELTDTDRRKVRTVCGSVLNDVYEELS